MDVLIISVIVRATRRSREKREDHLPSHGGTRVRIAYALPIPLQRRERLIVQFTVSLNLTGADIAVRHEWAHEKFGLYSLWMFSPTPGETREHADASYLAQAAGAIIQHATSNNRLRAVRTSMAHDDVFRRGEPGTATEGPFDGTATLREMRERSVPGRMT